MSDTLTIVPPAEYPMSAQEAMAYGRLMEQRAQIDRQIEGVANQAKARLGISVETMVELDLHAAAYRVKS